MTGSGGKTLSGPQSGIIVWNNRNFSEKIYNTIFPTLTGSHQINRVFALAIALLENREFGKIFLNKVVENAKYLANELYDMGLDVLGKDRGFTQTHQVLINVSQIGGGKKIAKKLEKANIIVNKMLVPSDLDNEEATPSGIRLGLCELTRKGVLKEDIKKIANFMRAVIFGDKNISDIKEEVKKISKKYIIHSTKEFQYKQKRQRKP